MSRPSRLMTMSAAVALALLPAGFAASSAFADDTTAPETPAFTLSQTATGFDLTIVGTGATITFTVGADGSVEAADSEADEAEVDLPSPTTPASAADEQQADNEGQAGPDEQQGDNNDEAADDGQDEQAGDQQGPNDESGDQGSDNGGSDNGGSDD